MDFVVHGTKGGYKTLFKSNKALKSSLFDIRSDNPPESTIGEKAYAIRSFQNKIIYSKYKIVRDVVGDKRTGFIGFSLFVSKNEKIEPRNILTLLDSISGKYFELYVKNNNLDSLNESWSFIEEIIKLYNPILRPTTFEILKSGLVNDAVAYYNTTDELEKNWQKGFMSHFTKFKQVLFISEDLRGSDKNPINAIRNSGEVIDINKFPTTQQPPPIKIPETTEPEKPNFPAKAILILSAALVLVLSIVLFVVSMDSDTDGDGVKDSDDRCLDVPGLPDLYGCPDTDGDGVSDEKDHCPDVAGLPALAGCPDAETIEVTTRPTGEIFESPQPLSISEELLEKLRGSEISKDKLNELKSSPDFRDDLTLSKCVGLYLKFFEVSNKNKEEYYSKLYKKVKEDEILKTSQLENYLQNISDPVEGQNLIDIIDGSSKGLFSTLKEFQEELNLTQ